MDWWVAEVTQSGALSQCIEFARVNLSSSWGLVEFVVKRLPSKIDSLEATPSQQQVSKSNDGDTAEDQIDLEILEWPFKRSFIFPPL